MRKEKVTSQEALKTSRAIDANSQKGHYANKCDNERVDDMIPEIGGTKVNAQKKQAGTTLLTDGDIYDLDFLDDQDEFANYQFVNTDMRNENEEGIVMRIEGD